MYTGFHRRSFNCRSFLLVAAVGLFAAAPLAAQQEDPGAHVYLAYYKVGFEDLEEYLTLYHEVEAPLMNTLVEEGVINGFGLQMHNVGGEYNIRQSIRTSDWASMGDFWTKHLDRYGEQHPREFERANEMLLAHTDEIWDITSSNVTAGAQFAHMYDSKFQVAFSEMDAWNAAWDEFMVPMMDQAIADGILGGWVIENHNTGGPDNWKVLYLFEEWDDIDDFFGQVLPQAMSNPRMLALMDSAMQSHDDIIWDNVAPPGN